VLADQVKSLDWRARRATRKGRVSPAELEEVRAKLRALVGQSHAQPILVRREVAAMPELTASAREAARRLGVSNTTIHKAERAGRIAREPDGQWDIDKTRRRLTETADPARPQLRLAA
jgi:hypothetical protein